MSLRPPRLTSRADATGMANDALQQEMLQESASALGRLGRALEAALAAIEACDAGRGTDADRKRLVRQAGTALWHLVVQREACGLRSSAQLYRDYRVPQEVINAMGIGPPADRR
ncbi:DUF6665 family protein [Chelatococcus daeguensis]|nr:DUF6665 family protein [Chelatococcus daeguensis]